MLWRTVRDTVPICTRYHGSLVNDVSGMSFQRINRATTSGWKPEYGRMQKVRVDK